ncbi:serine/threonine-protein kinase pkn1-like [Saccoglossus kowalevskii]|uniref:Sulfatase-modifying factor 1-like n=1 Tax=Saccoglossus kowalevskii TaxID=10224 RepID=A0ABM0LYX4_SACKO|nr:PREDICTED: sulfatase-modifying factor 1-like [Saccoglossus kowalevskii]
MATLYVNWSLFWIRLVICVIQFYKVLSDGPPVTMVSVPDGFFEMGSQLLDDDSHATLVHTIFISSFLMSETEVTNNAYVTFLNEAMTADNIKVETRDGSSSDDTTDEVVVGKFGGFNPRKVYIELSGTNQSEEHPSNRCWIQYDAEKRLFSLLNETLASWPVTFVTWYGADAFAKFYNYSLPTEAEWEFAAKGGDRELPFGSKNGELNPDVINFAESNYGHPINVKHFASNPNKLYHISGNVWEWVLDWFCQDFYAASTTMNPYQHIGFDSINMDPDVTSGFIKDTKVIRGGSWKSTRGSDELYTSYRGRRYPGHASSVVGFRVVQRTSLLRTSRRAISEYCEPKAGNCGNMQSFQMLVNLVALLTFNLI